MDEPCQYLEWDSRFFGLEIARVTANRLDVRAIEAVDQWCSARNIDCLYFLADDSLPATTTVAENGGFHLVDLRVTLSQSVRSGASKVEAAGVAVRHARQLDVPALRAIARVSHRDSRFYRDGGFEQKRCDALYDTWIERSCTGHAAAVLVAEVDGAPAGYVTCERAETTAARIGLFAVAAANRGRGIGEALVQSSLAWLAEHEVESVAVVTQGTNIAAQRLYQRCGFRTKSVQLWYHRWRGRAV